MATSFEDIYNRAIFRFADYKFLTQDISVREGVLQKYLLSAITDFQHTSKISLEYDLPNNTFLNVLDDDIIEVLALGIAYYWVSYKTMDSKLLKNVLNSKDYYYYSPANLLKEVQTLRATIGEEFNSKMRKYSFINNDMDTWTA